MTDASPTPGRPHNPFRGVSEPEPFHRSPEFQRFIWLAGMLVVVGIVGFYFASNASRKEAAETAVAEQTAALPPLLGPEERQAREDRLSTVLEGSLADTKNATDFSETSGYRRLIQILMSFPAEEVEQRAVRKLDYAAAMADPDAWRGEFVWARGLVAEMYANRLKNPVFGMQDVYQGILTEGDGTNGVFFDLIGEPPPLKLRNDPIDVFGIFYRTVRYEPLRPEKEEGEFREAPYLLVKTIRKVERPKIDPAGVLGDHYAVTLIGMALAIAAARLLVYVFARRSRRSAATPRPQGAGFRDMFESKRRQDKRTEGPRSEA